MAIDYYPIERQAVGNFNNGEILEKKPVGFPQDKGILKPYSNIFYWAHAWTTGKRSTIGLHPHQGFEICTFVLKGSINHYDSFLKRWIRLNEGDVQIINSGSGISHSEEILENSEIFQIWFDPNLSKSLKKAASYSDFKKNDFNISNHENFSVRLIHHPASKIYLDSENIIIKEYIFKPSYIANLFVENGKIHSFFVVDGQVSIDGVNLSKGDFFTVKKIRNIKIETINDTKLFEISSPINPSYRTYFG